MAINIKQNADGTTDLYNEQTARGVRLGGPDPATGTSDTAFRGSSFLKFSLGTNPGTAGVASILSPFPETVLVGMTMLHVTAGFGTQTQGTLTMGVGGASSTTYTNNLIDHITAVSASVLDNVSNKGTSGSSSVEWATATYLTITAGQTPHTLVGNGYVEILRP